MGSFGSRFRILREFWFLGLLCSRLRIMEDDLSLNWAPIRSWIGVRSGVLVQVESEVEFVVMTRAGAKFQ